MELINWIPEIWDIDRLEQWSNFYGNGLFSKRCDTEVFGQTLDMIFVLNLTQPDFQAKNFTPQNCVI